MKTLFKILLLIPLLTLGGCYTQLALRDSHEYDDEYAYEEQEDTTYSDNRGEVNIIMMDSILDIEDIIGVIIRAGVLQLEHIMTRSGGIFTIHMFLGGIIRILTVIGLIMITGIIQITGNMDIHILEYINTEIHTLD